MMMTDMRRNNLQKLFEMRKLDVSVVSRVSQPYRPDFHTCKSLLEHPEVETFPSIDTVMNTVKRSCLSFL